MEEEGTSRKRRTKRRTKSSHVQNTGRGRAGKGEDKKTEIKKNGLDRRSSSKAEARQDGEDVPEEGGHA